MVVERISKYRPESKTTGDVPARRADHFRLNEELVNTELTPESRADKEVQLLWVDLSLGFISAREHKIGLRNYFKQLDTEGNQAAIDYLDGEVQIAQDRTLPRVFEIRDRAFTREQLAKIPRVVLGPHETF